MKTNLFKSLLVAVIAVGAWGGVKAQNVVTETYEFYNWATASKTNSNFTTGGEACKTGDKEDGTSVYYITNKAYTKYSLDRFATNETRNFYIRGHSKADYTGVFCVVTKTAYFSILNLKDGDVITIKTPNAPKFKSTNVLIGGKNVNVDDKVQSDKEYTVSTTGKTTHLDLYFEGYNCIQNITIKTTVDKEEVEKPTISVVGVNGMERTVAITANKGNLGSTPEIYYTTNNETPTKASTKYTKPFSISSTTTVKAIAYISDEVVSDVESNEVAAGTELSLATPVASITKMGEGFARTYSVVCNNKDVLLTPTAKLTYDFTPSGEGEAKSGVECNGTIEATAAGTYVVTASAEGYTSTSVTINNTKEYELTKTIDLTTLKAEDLSANWKKKAENAQLDGNNRQWRAKYGNVVTDKYFYDFSAESASATDVLAGLNVEINKDGKAPVLFTGFGMMYPIYQMNADGDDLKANGSITDGKLSIADGTADQVGVYTYINNYGKGGTKTTVVAGDKEFALYRFSDMLTKIEIYSPKITETVSVSDAGYATYATKYNVEVPNDENVKVMTVKVNEDKSTITLNDVAAGTVIPAKTGILVKAAQGNHDFVVTSKEGAKLENNSLIAATTNVTSYGAAFFALTKMDTKVGFAVVNNGVVIPAGKAYLSVPRALGAKFFSLDGEATGINSVKTAKADGAYYTLEGVKTTKPVKGLYIHNGKKIVVK